MPRRRRRNPGDRPRCWSPPRHRGCTPAATRHSRRPQRRSSRRLPGARWCSASPRVSAHRERRVKSAVLQRHNEHRCRRRLTVQAGDHQRGVWPAINLAVTTGHGITGMPRRRAFDQFGVGLGNRGKVVTTAVDPPGSRSSDIVMPDADRSHRSAQRHHDSATPCRRTRYQGPPRPSELRGNARMPGSADTDHVHPLSSSGATWRSPEPAFGPYGRPLRDLGDALRGIPVPHQCRRAGHRLRPACALPRLVTVSETNDRVRSASYDDVAAARLDYWHALSRCSPLGPIGSGHVHRGVTDSRHPRRWIIAPDLQTARSAADIRRGPHQVQVYGTATYGGSPSKRISSRRSRVFFGPWA